MDHEHSYDDATGEPFECPVPSCRFGRACPYPECVLDDDHDVPHMDKDDRRWKDGEPAPGSTQAVQSALRAVWGFGS